MMVYRFRSFDGRQRALTLSPIGDALPRQRADWEFLGRQYLDEETSERLGAPPEMVRDHVEREGYFVLPNT